MDNDFMHPVSLTDLLISASYEGLVTKFQNQNDQYMPATIWLENLILKPHLSFLKCHPLDFSIPKMFYFHHDRYHTLLYSSLWAFFFLPTQEIHLHLW